MAALVAVQASGHTIVTQVGLGSGPVELGVKVATVFHHQSSVKTPTSKHYVISSSILPHAGVGHVNINLVV